MSDQQLKHFDDEGELASEWDQDRITFSEVDQVAVSESIAGSKDSTTQNNESFGMMTPLTDEATGAARRAELAEQIAAEEEYVQAQELIQSIHSQYDQKALESAAKIVEKLILEDLKVPPDNSFAKVAAKYASRAALGLSELPQIHQEQGEQ